jgi:hypothetical protein
MKTTRIVAATLGCILGMTVSALAYTQARLYSGQSIGLGQAISTPQRCILYWGSHPEAPDAMSNQCSGGHLILQATDGNLVLYVNNVDGAEGHAVWSPQIEWQGAVTATMLPGGNFVVLNANSQILFETHTDGHPGAYLRILDNIGTRPGWEVCDSYTEANLYILDAGGHLLWSAFDNDRAHYHPACLWLPGSDFAWNLNNWTSIYQSDGAGHDRYGSDLPNMPIYATSEWMCQHYCTARDWSTFSRDYYGPTFGTDSCAAYAYDTSNGNCWLKHCVGDRYNCQLPALGPSGASEVSGYIDPFYVMPPLY